jgi:hypothetical protein
LILSRRGIWNCSFSWQRAVGYSLTGDVSEEVLFFLHGRGRSGKTTFLEAIKAALGDYAKTADFDTLLQRTHAGGPRARTLPSWRSGGWWSRWRSRRAANWPRAW